jgi:hypothetical protein
MSFANITLSGTIVDVKQEDKNYQALFQPDSKNAPVIIVKAYGNVGERLSGLNGYQGVVTGKAIHSDSKSIFNLELSECYLSGEYGEPKAIAAIVGRYSTKFAKHKDIGGKQCYEFQVSYPCGKSDGKTQYFNWNVASFGKNAENIHKYFEDGKTIGLTTEIKWYAKDSDHLYLNATVLGWNFVGGKGE